MLFYEESCDYSINRFNEELNTLGFKLSNKIDVETVIEVLYELRLSVKDLVKSKLNRKFLEVL